MNIENNVSNSKGAAGVNGGAIYFVNGIISNAGQVTAKYINYKPSENDQANNLINSAKTNLEEEINGLDLEIDTIAKAEIFINSAKNIYTKIKIIIDILENFATELRNDLKQKINEFNVDERQRKRIIVNQILALTHILSRNDLHIKTKIDTTLANTILTKVFFKKNIDIVLKNGGDIFNLNSDGYISNSIIKINNIPTFEFNYNDIDLNLNYKTEVEDRLTYDMKHSVFNVRENFTIDDIMRFMDYSFTHLTWGAVHFSLLERTDNHFYALEYPLNTSTEKFFFLVPVRIVQQCLKEGKEYTRAQCNGNALNILVFFDKIPDKFMKIIEREEYNESTLSKSLNNNVPNLL